MKSTLKSIIEDTSTVLGRRFDTFIQVLILLSLISFAIGTLPNLNSQAIYLLETFELICVVLFSIEYVLRVVVSDKPFKYIFSFYGLIDLLAILPFYLRTALDLRALRAFRVFRVFRTFKVIRYNQALHRFGLAFKIVKEEMMLFFLVTAILIFLSASGIYFFEHKAQPEVFASVFHSLWWAVVTLTTVGYGDVYPITIGGRVFTFFVLIMGVGVVTVPAGLIATALTKARELNDKNKSE